MDMTIQFTTQEAANAAVTVLSSALGLPKYGLKGDGTPNTDVIIDRYANPEEVDGKWQIPVTNEAQLLIDGGGLRNRDFEIEEHEVSIPIYVIVTKQSMEELNGDETDEEVDYVSVQVFGDAYLDKEKALKELKDGYLEAEIIEVKG